MTGSANPLAQALDWQVTFWSGEATAEERDGFDHWLRQDPAHARAWAQVQRSSEPLRSLRQPAAGAALRAAGASEGAPAPRRQWLRMVALAAGAGVAAYGARQSPQWQSFAADHRTGRGELRELLLPDGTRLVLNTASAIDLRFSARARDVFLRAGEIHIATAADPQAAQGLGARPFTVHTAQGGVRALGTRFVVRQLDDRSLAAVEEGAVEIRPHRRMDGDAGAQRVGAGLRAWFTDRDVTPPSPLPAAASGWTRGLLVAERMRLDDLLAELGRYRPGVLRCDPAVRGLVVSGVYPLDDTELALSTLAQALPVRIERVTGWWVTVRPRAG